MDHLKKQIILKNKEERRILAGHPWVFSNEIRETKGAPQIGDVVELIAASGKVLGIGFYNPHSLIAVRLLSHLIEEVNAAFFEKRILQALALRRKLFPQSETFRLVHSESDFLPGLVIDKFNDYLSVQTFSFGMNVRLSTVCDVLEALLHPKGIVERNESPLRELEQLPIKKGILRGSIEPTIFTDDDLKFEINVLEGQKSGFFLDQRENRNTIRRFSKNANVLDCFCNEGGFALHAAKANAASVVAIDSSEDALQRASRNAALNQLSNIEFVHDDVFKQLKQLEESGRRFDVVVLDPPSFTKSKKNVQTAKQGYKELHTGAIRILKPGGILMTASCSHHIQPEVFLEIVDATVRKQERIAQLLDWRGASADHPVLYPMSETRYLKFGVFRVL